VQAAVPGATLSGAAWRIDEPAGETGWAWRLSDGDGGPDVTRARILTGGVSTLA
jgi:hypothetical protein